MLQIICEKLRNWFDRDKFGRPIHAENGDYRIVNGMIPLPFIKEGQRFRIVGSALNDGIYTYHADGIRNDDDTEVVGLMDEDFSGTVCAMAVPPAVIALSSEINKWVEKNGEAVSNPYTSESVIGVYSYTKASGGSGAGGSITWEDAYRDRLDAWRKTSP